MGISFILRNTRTSQLLSTDVVSGTLKKKIAARERRKCVFCEFFSLRKFYTSDRSLLEGNNEILKFVLQNSHLERLPFLTNFATTGRISRTQRYWREREKKILRYLVNHLEYERSGTIRDKIGTTSLIMTRTIGNIVSCFLIL